MIISMTKAKPRYHIRLLGPGDERVFDRVAPEVFDDPIAPAAAMDFLREPNHLIAVALRDDVIVGFASGVHCVHPDKDQGELWINEIGVTPAHQRHGVGKRLLDALFARARALGCADAWVLTDRSNEAAMALYAAAGGETPSDHVMVTFVLDEPDTQD
jgi:aminoglycoside 6'-N-acetyltransferase I